MGLIIDDKQMGLNPAHMTHIYVEMILQLGLTNCDTQLATTTLYVFHIAVITQLFGKQLRHQWRTKKSS